ARGPAIDALPPPRRAGVQPGPALTVLVVHPRRGSEVHPLQRVVPLTEREVDRTGGARDRLDGPVRGSRGCARSWGAAGSRGRLGAVSNPRLASADVRPGC